MSMQLTRTPTPGDFFFIQFRPPSVVLNISPVLVAPAYKVPGAEALIARPVANTDSVRVQVAPPSTVLNRPYSPPPVPPLIAAYSVLGSTGLITRNWTLT